MAETKLKVASRRNVIRSLGQPKVAVMLMLGFSSGLPFMLSANTLGYWLREVGFTLQAIGFLSWVGLAYSLKFLWAPIVDRVDAPLFGRLGRRRGWMLLTQLLVAAGLIGLAMRGPGHGLAAVGVFALVVAFSSATQDIVVDAWRIEAASDSDELGLLSSAYQLGYRAALLVDRRPDPAHRQPFQLAGVVHDDGRADGDWLRGQSGGGRTGACRDCV